MFYITNNKMNTVSKNEEKGLSKTGGQLKRRAFMRYTGASVGVAALILTGCEDNARANAKTNDDDVDLGSGDAGILNYAYALEQLEAAFYLTVVAHSAFTTTFSEDEQSILMDIKDHEVIHRDFFKAALSTSAIPDLEVDFSSIDFADRASVLNTAKAFEDLGVSAYNGAGKLLESADYLLVAGKIVSVEARHAAVIRDLLNPKSKDFAGDDVVDAMGLDGARTPLEVLTAAAPYIKTSIKASNLPTV